MMIAGIQIGGEHKEIIGLEKGASVQHDGADVHRKFSGDMVWNALSGHKVDSRVNCGDRDCTNQDCIDAWNSSDAEDHCGGSNPVTVTLDDSDYSNPKCTISTICNRLASISVPLGDTDDLIFCNTGTHSWRIIVRGSHTCTETLD